MIRSSSVQAAPYDEQAEPANSGTADNVVTYLAASGTRPKLRSFNMETKNYIVVNGFEITNDGMLPQPGDAGESIRINETTGIKISITTSMTPEGLQSTAIASDQSDVRMC